MMKYKRSDFTYSEIAIIRHLNMRWYTLYTSIINQEALDSLIEKGFVERCQSRPALVRLTGEGISAALACI